MATPSIQFPQNYSGEALDYILQLTAKSNETYKNGLIHVETDVPYKLYLPVSEMGDVIQDNVATPTSKMGEVGEDGFNEYKITERLIEPQDFMVYKEFDPATTRSYWKGLNSKGNLLFEQLSDKVQADFVSKVLERKNVYIGEAIWKSVKGGDSASKAETVEGLSKLGTGSLKYFDGAIERLVRSQSDKGVDKAILAGTAKIDTPDAAFKAFDAVFNKLPDHMRGMYSELEFVCSHTTFLLYDRYLTDKVYKNANDTELNVAKFKAIKVTPITGIPEHTIVLSKFGKDISSNLWMGINWAAPKDEDAFVINRLAPNSRMYFIQMRMMMDVNWVRLNEIVFYTPYAKEAEVVVP